MVDGPDPLHVVVCLRDCGLVRPAEQRPTRLHGSYQPLGRGNGGGQPKKRATVLLVLPLIHPAVHC